MHVVQQSHSCHRDVSARTSGSLATDLVSTCLGSTSDALLGSKQRTRGSDSWRFSAVLARCMVMFTCETHGRPGVPLWRRGCLNVEFTYLRLGLQMSLQAEAIACVLSRVLCALPQSSMGCCTKRSSRSNPSRPTSMCPFSVIGSSTPSGDPVHQVRLCHAF